MNILSVFLTIAGLCLFEAISSIDNAIINAQVLSNMSQKAKSWFLSWGILISVVLFRGLLPWIIVYLSAPRLGIGGSFTAMLSNDPGIHKTIQSASPILLIGGGTFLLLLFFSWLFLEEKHFGLRAERFFQRLGVWFFALASIVLAIIVWFALRQNPLMAFSAVLGSTAFFITHGFRENAEKQEEKMLRQKNKLSDTSKLLYLMVIDTTFSLDGVLGAFAYTLSVPLILIGNGLGVVVIRQLTVSKMEQIKKYIYLENGAMYSVFVLGLVMILNSFGFSIPQWFSPIATFVIVGYFFFKSHKHIK